MRRALALVVVLLFACGDEETVPPYRASPASAGTGGASLASGVFLPALGGAAQAAGSTAVSAGAAGASAGAGGAIFPAPTTVSGTVHIGSDGSKSDFQTALIPFEAAGPFASATLAIDLTSPCFPFAKWTDDPPPTGQNWPADCDAFDRNFEMEIDPPKAMGDAPAIEVIRAITPFGGPEHVDADVTDVLNGLTTSAHVLSVHITTYSDSAGMVSGSNGGWDVGYSLVLTPGPAASDVIAIEPIFDGSYDAMNVPPPSTFTVPDGATKGRIEVRATGHGGPNTDAGCIGPAEEFCKRTHTLSVDDATVATSQLWRTDCATLCTIAHQGVAPAGFDYCVQNPCGSIDSVKAPRANWCPGSETPPWVIDVSALAPGMHGFADVISRIAPGGSWRVSAVYVATK